MENNENILYEVIFYWDTAQSNVSYKQYCAETLCNILGLDPSVAVHMVYDAEAKMKTTVLSTHDLDEAIQVRDSLTALELLCQIRPHDFTIPPQKNQHENKK